MKYMGHEISGVIEYAGKLPKRERRHSRHYLVTFSKDCREDLSRLGNITFEDAELMKDFVILDTIAPIETIRAVDGVTNVEEERVFSLFV